MKTTEEMIAVMQAYADGKEIEFKQNYYPEYSLDWSEATAPNWQWFDCDYRIAPPKPLTPDFIEWSHVSPEWKYMARDEDGEVYLYMFHPLPAHLSNGWHAGLKFVDASVFASYKQGTVDWKESLVERPEGV